MEIVMAIIFNAVKGNQRNTTYFSANITFGEIEKCVQLPEEVLGEDILDEHSSMQRKLNWNRVNKEMVPYLLKDDAFFSSITLFMIPRDFSELEEGHGYNFKTFTDIGDSIGQLMIDGSMIMFPADGQHRVGTIKQVLKTNPELGTVSVPVILIPFKSRGQVRQYFTDLNLHAKKVNNSIGLTFETRDPIALITKELEKQVPLFRDSINHFSTSLSAKSRNVITINTAYTCTALIMKNLRVKQDELRGIKPDDEKFKKELRRVTKVWNKVIDCLPGFDLISQGGATAGQIREKYVHPHGVGWQAVVLAASTMIDQINELDWEARFQLTCANIDWSRDNSDWQSICMIGDRMNNTNSFVRSTAGYILSRADVVTGAGASLVKHYETTKRAALAA